MSPAIITADFGLADLDLSSLQVTAMRDAVALPETGASSGSSSCGGCSTCGSSSCCGGTEIE
ncbi:thiazolylpeptide-type bacteriocin [Streptosporangium sandarakinum]|uniref:Thiazolylpeptide-type bacteriocin n=1 Tax=Streptosporangium pseudovulgare TaxID=35765 RepID=A0ABQ2RAM5_9ACTN|nr:thiazolylpeptide-type bacteriocin [Streptosporangium pseudovulgare]GGQ22249.1 hypothetical protein GCM10010140_60640 [Streptosporangium pseudovulgare]